jgi:hypothetical protein
VRGNNKRVCLVQEQGDAVMGSSVAGSVVNGCP